MPTEVTMHVVFDRAAEIAKRGWTGGVWQIGDDRCILQCVMFVLGKDGRQEDTGLPVQYLYALDNVLVKNSEYRNIRAGNFDQYKTQQSRATIIRRTIIEWNDSPGRHQGQVVRLLKTAAKRAEGRWWREHNRLLAADPTISEGISPHHSLKMEVLRTA